MAIPTSLALQLFLPTKARQRVHTHSFGDLVSEEVIDSDQGRAHCPTGCLVSRRSLVTTEAMVAELPKKEHAHAPMLGGGGMVQWTTRSFPEQNEPRP